MAVRYKCERCGLEWIIPSGMCPVTRRIATHCPCGGQGKSMRRIRTKRKRKAK